MANTTLSNLKIKCLRQAGNSYNANDTAKLTLAGEIINDIFGMAQSLLKGHPYTLDIGNTVNTTAAQAYVDLVDTDIIDILQFYQSTTNTKLKQITWAEYIALAPNQSIMSGVPELAWAPTQSVNGSGVNIWRPYFLPTPSSVITLKYDYEKNLKLASDAAYSPFPSIYDAWIAAEFKPLFFSIVASTDTARITKAEQQAQEARAIFLQALKSPADRYQQVASARERASLIYNRVATTPAP